MYIISYYFIYPVGLFLFSVWIYICYLKDHFSDYACDDYDFIEAAYDYVVVGAGTAGLVAALRLAENSAHTILLVEAGGDSSFPMNIPVLGPLLQRSKVDWQYHTVPQENACLGLENNRSNWPMGRVVGGSSKLNNMLYIRGHRRDYDRWSADGSPTWGYNEQARSFFRRSERQMESYRNDSLYHGYEGLWPVSDLGYFTPFSEAVIAGGVEMGYGETDLNGGVQTGFMRPQVNAVNGSRFTLETLLESYPNIRLVTNSVVDKVIFKSNFEAVGVRLRRLGRRQRVLARRATVLAAGVIGSPKILMLSGIGPRKHLESLGITVINDLPVGKNLQDHITTGLDLIKLKEQLPVSVDAILSPLSAYEYYTNGSGPWTFPGCEVIALIHSKLVNPATDPPDLQLMAVPAGVSSDGGMVNRKNQGISEKLWQEYFRLLVGQQVATVLPVLLHPKSRGQVTLASRHYLDKPIIDPRYLSHPDDLRVLLEGIRLVKKLISTRSMQRLGAELNTQPLPGCEAFTFDSRPYWECYVRHLTMTAYHQVGTCKMGPASDPTTVVDGFLRVHRTNRLRVMDASVMPTIVSGNVNAAVAMIAEKGVDMIKNYWHNIRTVCRKQEVFFPNKMTLSH